MSNIEIIEFSRSELMNEIFRLQNWIQAEKENGKTVDEILYNSNEFEKFEEVLNEEVYSIFLLTVLNNFKSDDIINTILDAVEKLNLTKSRSDTKRLIKSKGIKVDDKVFLSEDLSLKPNSEISEIKISVGKKNIGIIKIKK